MEKKLEIFLAPSSLFCLEVIQQISFSTREVDILACLIGCRTAKKIAALLLLSPRTVENHIRNLAIKIGCNSRDGIITFIEQSDQVNLLQDHYKQLQIQSEFEKSLKNIAKINTLNASQGIFFYEEGLQSSLLASFQSHLKMARLTITGEKVEALPHKAPGELKSDFFLYILSEATVKKLQEGQSISSIASLIANSPETVLYICFESQQATDSLRDPKNPGIYCYIQEENYYFLVFNILKKLIPSPEIETLFLEFKKKYEQIMKHSQGLYFSSDANKTKEEKNMDPINSKALSFLQSLICFFKKRNRFVVTALLIFILFSVGGVYLKNDMKNKEPDFQQNANSIRSDLLLPTEEVFLDRPALINQIEGAFKGPEPIRLVALVGVGGAGKTTLARKVALTQSASLVWEINAETKENLNRSFEDLAQALAKTEEEKKNLKDMQEIQIPDIKNSKILLFVKDHLKAQPNWFLIYDNVENLMDIRAYVPQDEGSWGRGKVLITTRNSHIQNNTSVHVVLPIDILTPQEKIVLFTKIMAVENSSSVESMQQIELQQLLEDLPSFPLDVSIAAHYLKITQISPKTYRQYLHILNLDFIDVQKKILQETGDYLKTRYAIITQSLEYLIKNHKDFAELLLFISLLDSQNIPRELLEKHKSEPIVDSFIFNLKKHSLITNSLSSSTASFIFSIHRSSQAISFVYLSNFLNLNKDSPLLKEIVYTIDDYSDQILEQEDYSRMQMIARHIEKFLNHSDLLTDFSVELLKSKLGCLYYFINDDKSYLIFKDAIQKLKIKKLENLSSDDISRVARLLLHIGAVYTELRLDKEAQEVFEKAVSVYDKEVSKDYSNLSWALSHLGNVHRRLGNYEKARDYLEESIRLNKKYVNNNKRIARTLAYLGSVYRGLGFHQKAIDSLNESLVLYNTYYPHDHFRVGWVLIQLGNVFNKLGVPQKAKEYLEDGLLIFQKHLPDSHVNVGLAFAYLGSCYRKLGDYEKSRHYLEKSLVIHQKHFDKNHLRMGWTLFHLASTYKEIGNHQEAQKLFDKVLEIYANHCGEENIETARLLRDMAGISLEKDRLDDAEKFINRSLKILQYRNHVDVYKSFEVLGEIYLEKSLQLSHAGKGQESQDLKNKALDTFNQALKITEQQFPKNSVHIQRIKSKIKNIEE